MSFFTMMARAQSPMTILSFNCENAFDISHDVGKDDSEYVEGGKRNWSKNRFYKKLNGIAQVIAAADTIKPVGIVVLCEVENDTVLHYLLHKTPLKSMNYDYVMTDSPDKRGVDVAIIYSHFVYRPVMVESVRPKHVGTPTRDILHVAGVVPNGDTLDVYSVHLPSKLGGKEGNTKSMQVTQGLKMHVDSVLSVRQTGKVIVLGDYNAEFKSPQISEVLSAGKYWSTDVRPSSRLFDVVEEKVPKGLGSYKYKGKWSVIDHVLVSGNVSLSDAGILTCPILLENDDKYGGVKPKRTYVGYKYNGGISDHLPVWIRVNM